MSLKITLQKFLEKIKERFYTKNEVYNKNEVNNILPKNTSQLINDSNYITSSDVNTNYQKKLIAGEGISISDEGIISINYTNGDDLTYGSE